MKESPKEEKKTGCCAWLIQIKKSVNERWAKARNRLRKRFHKNNGTPLNPEDLINDTGMHDMEVTMVAVKDKTRTPAPDPLTEGECIGFRNTAAPLNESETDGITTDETMRIRGTANGEPDSIEVRLFVVDLIEKASEKYREEMAILPPPPTPRDYTNNVAEVEEDTVSLSSSVLSALAEVAVRKSLSKVIEDMNESAKRKDFPPRTVTEVLERLSIDPNVGIVTPESTDMPPCSG